MARKRKWAQPGLGGPEAGGRGPFSARGTAKSRAPGTGSHLSPTLTRPHSGLRNGLSALRLERAQTFGLNPDKIKAAQHPS